MEDLFELDNENGFDQRRTYDAKFNENHRHLQDPKEMVVVYLSSLEVSSDFSSRSNSVDAGEATEALTFVQDDASLRERIVDFLHISGIDRVLDFLQAIFSLIACTLYVIESYDRDLEMNLYVLVVELFIGCFFCLITVLRCFCQKIRGNLFSLISV